MKFVVSSSEGVYITNQIHRSDSTLFIVEQDGSYREIKEFRSETSCKEAMKKIRFRVSSHFLEHGKNVHDRPIFIDVENL